MSQAVLLNVVLRVAGGLELRVAGLIVVGFACCMPVKARQASICLLCFIGAFKTLVAVPTETECFSGTIPLTNGTEAAFRPLEFHLWQPTTHFAWGKRQMELGPGPQFHSPTPEERRGDVAAFSFSGSLQHGVPLGCLQTLPTEMFASEFPH